MNVLRKVFFFLLDLPRMLVFDVLLDLWQGILRGVATWLALLDGGRWYPVARVLMFFHTPFARFRWLPNGYPDEEVPLEYRGHRFFTGPRWVRVRVRRVYL